MDGLWVCLLWVCVLWFFTVGVVPSLGTHTGTDHFVITPTPCEAAFDKDVMSLKAFGNVECTSSNTNASMLSSFKMECGTCPDCGDPTTLGRQFTGEHLSTAACVFGYFFLVFGLRFLVFGFWL